MKAWILSDLHVDLDRRWDLPSPRPEYDVLVVAGDLTTKMERGVRWLRERVTDRAVVYIPGNHEGYGTDIDRTVEKARTAAAGTNIHVMQNDCVVLGDVRFIGSTLWTDFNLLGDPDRALQVAWREMNDYKRIRISHYADRLRPVHTLARHRQARAFIEGELARPFAGSTVVVTHHGADPCAITGQHPDDAAAMFDQICAAYASDLTSVIEKFSPTLWVHGHIHKSRDRTIGRTRIVTNPKGYPKPDHNPDFDPLLVVEI
jgi:Icc-related predicted phosphoesterase